MNAPNVTTRKTMLERMTSSVPIVQPHDSIRSVQELVMRRAAEFETINYIYVVDERGLFKGVMSLRELFRAPQGTQIHQVMQKDVSFVHEHSSDERAAVLAIQKNIKAIPVVSKDGVLLGVVPSDAILTILHEEHIEDALRFAGIHMFDGSARGFLQASIFVHIRKRILWLLLGLFGGIGVAVFIESFKAVLEVELALAAFIPMIVYLADAVGGQTQAIFIRSISFGMNALIFRAMLREFAIGSFFACLFGIVAFGATAFWQGLGMVAIIVGLSVFATTVIAMVIAVLLPWLFIRRGIDPAIASGPLATVLRDMMSVAVYFGIATAMLGSVAAV